MKLIINSAWIVDAAKNEKIMPLKVDSGLRFDNIKEVEKYKSTLSNLIGLTFNKDKETGEIKGQCIDLLYSECDE